MKTLTSFAKFALWIGLSLSYCWAQSGKLAGKVTDASGEPLVGAIVLINDTRLGAATDANGHYVIINVPPSLYSVRFSFVGYQTKLVNNIRVASNQTTKQDVQLLEDSAQSEVVINAERPIVDVGLTSSMASLSKEDMANLPVQSLDDVVNLQAGVVDGHFRGGRSGEVQYQVDGVSVNNPYNNTSTLKLDRSVLQEVQVISGTFDAEYGQAMSGVVNAVLRTGRDNEYEFNIEALGGDFISSNKIRFPHVQSLSPLARQNLQASVSGPIPLLKNTTFLLNGQQYYDEGFLFGTRKYMPTDSVNFERSYFYATGDGKIIPQNWSRQQSFLGKIANTSIKNIKIEYQAIGNIIRNHNYNHAFRLNPDGTKEQSQFSLVHGLDWTHTLSAKSFYILSFRQNYFDYKDYKYEDVHDPRYFEAGQAKSLSSIEDGAVLSGVDLGRFVQKSNILVSKGGYTRQVTNAHLFKLGYEYQQAQIEFGAPGIIIPAIKNGVEILQAKTDTTNAVVLKYKPVQGSLFAQDRIEWNDLKIRAGLRLEYFQAHSELPGDLQNPANSIAGAPTADPKPTSTKLALAPRLGVSFPILERSSMFFSYGHFYQMPGLGQLFSNADYTVLKELQVGSEDSKGVLGNPDLKPEFTVQYEFGFKSALNKALGLDLSLFYKDIRSLLGVEFVQTYTAARYARFTNIDFGNVEGFTLAFDYRGANLSASLDYTFQMATGNSSDPKETFNRVAAGGDPRPRQIAFNWDQRHTLNGTLTFFQANNFNVTAIAKMGSGQPYTPAIGSTFGSELETNSGRKQPFLLVDVRAEKFFKMGKLEATVFGRCFNLTDTHAVNGFVFNDTGSPYYTLIPLANKNTLNDPSRFNAPRRVEFGLTLRGVTKAKR
jgi:outer membrane receptor protein involved in Fe transport